MRRRSPYRSVDGGWCRDFDRLADYNADPVASSEDPVEMEALQERYGRWQMAVVEAQAALDGHVVEKMPGGGLLVMPPGL